MEVGLAIGRQEIYIPLSFVIRALVDISDLELRTRVLMGIALTADVKPSHARECIEKIFELDSHKF